MTFFVLVPFSYDSLAVVTDFSQSLAMSMMIFCMRSIPRSKRRVKSPNISSCLAELARYVSFSKLFLWVLKYLFGWPILYKLAQIHKCCIIRYTGSLLHIMSYNNYCKVFPYVVHNIF